jgi:hypothetical protein
MFTARIKRVNWLDWIGIRCSRCSGQGVHCDPCSWTGWEYEPFDLYLDWAPVLDLPCPN